LKFDDGSVVVAAAASVVAVLAALDQLGIDVDRGHVVDNHPNAQSVSVFQQVLERGGLSRSEKSAQERNGNRIDRGIGCRIDCRRGR